jgi:alpha-beta hydrolase superfamily lysophospholipase
MASVPCQDQCREATETHLPVCVWQDTARRPKGVVLLLHGIAERALTLNHLAQELVSDGFLVYGLDERGHGWWHFRQTKNDPGYNCHFHQTVGDVDKVLSCLKKEHPGLPLFIIGESIGAAIALRAAVDRPDAVDGLVVSGSGDKTAPDSMRWVLGDVLRNFWRWNHQIDVVRYQLKYCTDDLSSFADNLKDPEHRRTFSINETIRAGRFIGQNRKFARRLDPHIAVLVIQGANDHVLSPKSARKVFDALNTTDKRFVLVPECGHLLLQVNNMKPLVSDSITTFLSDRVSRRAACN